VASYLALSLRFAPDMLKPVEEEELVNKLVLAGYGDDVAELGIDCILGRYPDVDQARGKCILQICSEMDGKNGPCDKKPFNYTGANYTSKTA